MARRTGIILLPICLLLLVAPASSGAGCRVPTESTCGIKRAGAVEISKTAGLGQIEFQRDLGAVVQRDEGLVALLDMSRWPPRVVGRYDGRAAAGAADPFDGDVAFSSDGKWLFYARQTHQFSQDGLHVVDVSDPKSPRLAFYQPQGGTLRVAYYKASDAEYVITLDAINGLTVSRFDPSGAAGFVTPVFMDPMPPLSKVGGPASAGLHVDPKDPKLGIPLLYVGSGTGLDIYDLSIPEAPSKLGSWSDQGLADIEVVSSKGRRIVYAATEYWFDKQAEAEVIRLEATDLDAVTDSARSSFGFPVDDRWRVQGMDYADGRLYVTHSQGGLVVLDPRLRLVGASGQLGSANESHEAMGSPYAMDAEAFKSYVYVADASTGMLTAFYRPSRFTPLPGIAR